VKLEEIKPIDITKEIMESFDRVLPYTSDGDFISGGAKIFVYSIEGIEPVIKILVKTKIIQNLKIGELSFFTNERDFELLNVFSSGIALSIIATVIDLGKKFIPQLDVIFFTSKILVQDDEAPDDYKKASKEVKTKSRLYSRLAKRVAEENNLTYQSFTFKEDSGFVLTKEQEITKADITAYYDEWRN
jgi:hypothetical protein